MELKIVIASIREAKQVMINIKWDVLLEEIN